MKERAVMGSVRRLPWFAPLYKITKRRSLVSLRGSYGIEAVAWFVMGLFRAVALEITSG